MSFREWLKGKREYLIIGAAVLLALAVSMAFSPSYYAMNDDSTMKSILSGAYTGSPDGHAVYMKYPLTGILSLLYRWTNRVSWYDILMLGCFWGAITSVVGRCYALRTQLPQKSKGVSVCLVLGGVSLCFALFVPQIFLIHYTLVAAMVGGCGLFLLMTGGGAASVVLLVLCYCIRSQVFFLLLPFCLLVLLWNAVDRTGAAMLRYGLILAAGIMLCMLWNGGMYRSDAWQYYEEYNDSRTQLYDYDKLLPYEENADAFEAAGITQLRHRLLDEYALVLADDITPEVLETAAELTAAKRKEGRSGTEYLITCVKEYYYHIRYNDQPYNYILLGGCLAVLVLLLRQKQWLKLVLFGCFLGGRSLIWIFLIWRGRFPERVYVSLYFLEIMVLAGMLLQLWMQSKPLEENDRASGKRGKLSLVIAGVISCLLLAAGVSLCPEMQERLRERARNQEEWRALTTYCDSHPETTFLLDIYSTVDYSGELWSGVQKKENYLLAGGWMSESPLLKERISSLKPEECCYIIAADRETDWLSEYCGEYLGELRMEKTDSIYLKEKVLFDVYRPATE